MATYNGHKNWNHWNVSLWINNDYGLYSIAVDFIRQYHNKDIAAKAMYNSLVECRMQKTPDGAPYSVSSIRAAMRDM